MEEGARPQEDNFMKDKVVLANNQAIFIIMNLIVTIIALMLLNLGSFNLNHLTIN